MIQISLNTTRNMLTRLRMKMGLRILAAGVMRNRTINSIETKPTAKAAQAVSAAIW